jgi:hypothetical protein
MPMTDLANALRDVHRAMGHTVLIQSTGAVTVTEFCSCGDGWLAEARPRPLHRRRVE